MKRATDARIKLVNVVEVCVPKMKDEPGSGEKWTALKRSLHSVPLPLPQRENQPRQKHGGSHFIFPIVVISLDGKRHGDS